MSRAWGYALHAYPHVLHSGCNCLINQWPPTWVVRPGQCWLSSHPQRRTLVMSSGCKCLTKQAPPTWVTSKGWSMSTSCSCSISQFTADSLPPPPASQNIVLLARKALGSKAFESKTSACTVADCKVGVQHYKWSAWVLYDRRTSIWCYD